MENETISAADALKILYKYEAENQYKRYCNGDLSRSLDVAHDRLYEIANRDISGLHYESNEINELNILHTLKTKLEALQKSLDFAKHIIDCLENDILYAREIVRYPLMSPKA